LVHERVEALRIVDRDLAELLAVEHDLRLLQAVDELRVAHAAHASRRVDAHDPQAPVHALLRVAVALREGPGSKERLAHRAPQGRASAAKTLSLLEVAVLLLAARRAQGDAHHGVWQAWPSQAASPRLDARGRERKRGAPRPGGESGRPGRSPLRAAPARGPRAIPRPLHPARGSISSATAAPKTEAAMRTAS